jgi:hypothetical protein
LNEASVDAALEHEILNEAPNWIVSKCSDTGRAEPKATTESSGHVVLTAAFPGVKLASGVDTAFTGVKAKHDFSERNAVVGNIRSRANSKRHENLWVRKKESLSTVCSDTNIQNQTSKIATIGP